MGWRKVTEPEFVERRKTERIRTSSGSWVTDLDGNNHVKCLTLDHSYMGARIQVDSQQQVANGLYYLDVRNRLIYEAVVVWRAGSHAGLQFLKVYRFNEPPIAQLRTVIDVEIEQMGVQNTARAAS